MALKIAPMTVGHLDSVRRLFEMMSIETLSETPYPIMDDREVDNFVLGLYRQLQHNAYFAGWVAIRGHKIVGFLTAEVQERAVGKPNIFIFVHWLYVHPRHRQHGIARKLTAAGIEWSKTCFHTPITHIELFAQPGDDQWAKRGMAPNLVKYVMDISKTSQLFAIPNPDTLPVRIVR